MEILKIKKILVKKKERNLKNKKICLVKIVTIKFYLKIHIMKK